MITHKFKARVNKMAEQLLKIPKDLFKNVKFYLAEEGNEKVKDILKQGGANREFFFSSLATHVISSTDKFPEYEQTKENGIPIVKPEWVIYSVKCEAVMPTAPFSIEKKLFSDVVACPSKLPPDDRDALWAMITFYGGRCQATFDSKCSHLLVPKPEGEKYKVALQHAETVKIVIPEWILDCIKANKLLDESKYAPVPDEETQSQSILTPGNHGETTGAVVNAIVESVAQTPSSMLSPESPAVSKIKKLDESENITQESTNEILDQAATKGDSEEQSKTMALGSQDTNGPCKDEDNVESMGNNDSEKDLAEKKEVKENGSGDISQKTTYSDSAKEILVSKLLSECVFFISDYAYTLQPGVIDTWKKVIRQNAGEVEGDYTSKVTHVIGAHQHGPYFKKALSEGKRVVTCHWLNDVIMNRKLTAPQTPLHLPVPFKDKIVRCRKMIICVTGYQDKERDELKKMIYVIGAKYTGYLSKSVTHLICKNQTSEKYLKAKEWGIICINARWVADMMMGGCDYPVNMSRYVSFGNENELAINRVLAKELLVSWQGFKEKDDILDKKRKLEMLEREFKVLPLYCCSSNSQIKEHEEASKRPRLEEPACTPEPQPAAPTAPQTPVLDDTESVSKTLSPRVVFTGLNPTSVRRLSEKLEVLGGEAATSIRTCTHIVASKIMRTIKFLTGISVCRYIVSPQWIEKSHEEGKYLDETDYFLHDKEGEKLYGMSLRESITLAQRKPLFQGITIYVTANVRPDQKSMAEILDCAGGQLLSELPPKSQLEILAQNKTEDGHPAFVCVTCEEDTHLCKDMKMAGIGVHNVEFVLSGILKQQLDFCRYRF